jgi:hypothetical protein
MNGGEVGQEKEGAVIYTVRILSNDSMGKVFLNGTRVHACCSIIVSSSESLCMWRGNIPRSDPDTSHAIILQLGYVSRESRVSQKPESVSS